MKKPCLVLFLLLIPVSLFAAEIATVVVVSIDALHPLALTQKVSPNLWQVMQTGQYTLDGKSVTPPQTLINHSAMLTGVSPEKGGRTDNDWRPGQPQVALPTLFDDMKVRGYENAFFYSKPKLGYLAGRSLKIQKLAPDTGVDEARRFVAEGGKRFVMLHISGLEFAGIKHGWLSPEYLEEFTFIDDSLLSLLTDLKRRGNYLLIVTSDHAGHGKFHGTSHPEDYRLPFIILSDIEKFPETQCRPYHITELRSIVGGALKQKKFPWETAQFPFTWPYKR
jgi:predicted AlkP superfamily pyrophosphatase or phosphodiesterase